MSDTLYGSGDLIPPLPKPSEYPPDPEFMPTRQYHCIQLYNDGSVKQFYHWGPDARYWLNYSRIARFGCALFIDGVCYQYGSPGKERCEEFTRKYSAPGDPA